MLLGTAKAVRSYNTNMVLPLCNTPLDRVGTYIYLGLNLDANISLKDYSKKIIGTLSVKLNTLSYLRNYVNLKTLLLIYKTSVLPILEYANITHSLLMKAIKMKCQRLQNRALRIIYSNIMADTLEELHIRARIA